MPRSVFLSGSKQTIFAFGRARLNKYVVIPAFTPDSITVSGLRVWTSAIKASAYGVSEVRPTKNIHLGASACVVDLNAGEVEKGPLAVDLREVCVVDGEPAPWLHGLLPKTHKRF